MHYYHLNYQVGKLKGSSELLTSFSRPSHMSRPCPSIMWRPDRTTSSGSNSSRLATNVSSELISPLDTSWEKMKRLAWGARVGPHSSPGRWFEHRWAVNSARRRRGSCSEFGSLPALYSRMRWNSSSSWRDSGGTTICSSSNSWSFGPTGPHSRTCGKKKQT